jgi:hypothetical protein
MKKARKLPLLGLRGGAVIVHPVLPPPSIELVAVQVLPGVAVLLLIESQSAVTVPPPDFANVNVPDAPVRDSVTTFPEEPLTDHAAVVVVTFGKTIVCATVLVLAISENDSATAEMVVVDVDVLPPIVNLPYVLVPAINVLAVVVLSERIISPLPVIVAVEQFHKAPVPKTVHVPVPRPIVAEEAVTAAVVTEYVFALKVAKIAVIPPEVSVVVNASARLTVPEGFWQEIL